LYDIIKNEEKKNSRRPSTVFGKLEIAATLSSATKLLIIKQSIATNKNIVKQFYLTIF
jgi:hypothetical protein